MHISEKKLREYLRGIIPASFFRDKEIEKAVELAKQLTSKENAI